MPRSQGQNQRPSSAAHRVLFVPELLSLIFGHLAHYSQSEPCLCGCGYVGSAFGGIWEGVGDDGQVEGEGQPCHQPTEDRPANLTFSLTASSSNGVFNAPGPTKRPPHRTPSGPGHTTKVEFKDNKPSYNLNNALVCKTWCGAALDVLWRVVDRPERIFALLDGGVYRGNGEDAKKKPENQIDIPPKQRRIKTLKMVLHGHGRSPPSWGMGLRSFWKLCKAKEQSLIQSLDHPSHGPHHDHDHDYASNDGSQSSHSSDDEEDEGGPEQDGSGSDSESESEGEDDDPEDEEDQAVRQDGFVGWLAGLNLSDVVADNWAMGCKKMRWEVYNFTSPPTPASWARFDKYAHRVRHLVYRRPCLSHEALHAIALTRPRMEVFPKMKTLTWADNPLSWSVVFMHPGVKRFEVRVGAWAIEAAITLPEATWHPNADTVAEDANTNDQSRRKPLSLRDALTQTLTTHLSNIPNRMPCLTSLSISSFLPVSLLDEALTSSLFPALPGDSASQASAFNSLALTNGIAGIPQIPAPEANPGLQNLVALTLPRFYTTAPIIQSLSMLPNLKTLEFQYDERYGMGRWNDVGSVGRCVVPTWRNGADANERIIEENQRLIEESAVLGRGDWGDLSNHQRSDGISEQDEQRYKALEDLSLVIRFEDARILILSGGTTPLSSYVSSPAPSQPRQRTFPSNSASSYSHSQTPMFSSPSTPTATPNWPANLTILYLDSEALESPRTIRKLFEALAGCSRRLEKLSLVSARDSSGSALGEVGANFAGQGGAPAGNMGGAAVAGGIPGGVPLPEGPGGPDGEGYWNTWRSVRRERKFERDAERRARAAEEQRANGGRGRGLAASGWESSSEEEGDRDEEGSANQPVAGQVQAETLEEIHEQAHHGGGEEEEDAEPEGHANESNVDPLPQQSTTLPHFTSHHDDETPGSSYQEDGHAPSSVELPNEADLSLPASDDPASEDQLNILLDMGSEEDDGSVRENVGERRREINQAMQRGNSNARRKMGERRQRRREEENAKEEDEVEGLVDGFAMDIDFDEEDVAMELQSDAALEDEDDEGEDEFEEAEQPLQSSLPADAHLPDEEDVIEDTYPNSATHITLYTLQPILGTLPSSRSIHRASHQSYPHSDPSQSAPSMKATVPPLPLKILEIFHHRPLRLTHNDVEKIAMALGPTVEMLVLGPEPVHCGGIRDGVWREGTGQGVVCSSGPKASTTFAGVGGDEDAAVTDEDRHENDEEDEFDREEGATLTLGALLPFALHCPNLKYLGIFVDARKGLEGLLSVVEDGDAGGAVAPGTGVYRKPATLNHYPADTSNNRFPPGSLNEFTRCIGQRYFNLPSNPYSFPTFKKLTRLTMGTSPLEVPIWNLGRDLIKMTREHAAARREEGIFDPYQTREAREQAEEARVRDMVKDVKDVVRGVNMRRRRKARRAAKVAAGKRGAELYEVDDWDGFEIYTNRTDPFVDFFKWTNLPLGLDIEEDWDDMLDRYAATGGEVDDETGYRINEEEEDYLHETHQRRDNEIPVSSVQLQAVFISYLLPTASVPTPHQETRGRAPSRGQRSNIERIRGPNGREILALPAPPSFSPTPSSPQPQPPRSQSSIPEVFTLEAGVIWLPPPTPSSSILCSMLTLRCDGWAKLNSLIPMLYYVRENERKGRMERLKREVEELRIRAEVSGDLVRVMSRHGGGDPDQWLALSRPKDGGRRPTSAVERVQADMVNRVLRGVAERDGRSGQGQAIAGPDSCVIC